MILQYELDYGSGNPIGRQSLEISLSPRFFHMNLAPSRTFMLEAEAMAMKAQGLGQRVTCNDLLVFGRSGPIDNRLRFPTNACGTNGRYGRRSGHGRLRSGRPLRCLPQRAPSERGTGPTIWAPRTEQGDHETLRMTTGYRPQNVAAETGKIKTCK